MLNEEPSAKLTPSVTADAVPPPSGREALVRAGNFPSLSKGSLREGAVAVRRLGEFPKTLLYWVISVNYGLSRAIVRTIQYNLSLHRKIFQPILGTLHLPHFNIVIFA